MPYSPLVQALIDQQNAEKARAAQRVVVQAQKTQQQKRIAGAATTQLVSGATTAAASALGYGALGAVAGPLGLVAGLAVQQLVGSGGTAHGRGTASRAKHESAFAKGKRKLTLDANLAGLDAYVKKWTSKSGKVCGKASDPASCRDLIAIWSGVIDEQQQARAPVPAPVVLQAQAEADANVAPEYSGSLNSYAAPIPTFGALPSRAAPMSSAANLATLRRLGVR